MPGILFLTILTITVASLAAPAQSSPLKVTLLSNHTVRIRFPDNTTDLVALTLTSNLANHTTPCLFAGIIENDPHSVVAVSGCHDSEEISISIASSKVPGGLVDVVIVNEIGNIPKAETRAEDMRIFEFNSNREEEGFFIINDVAVPPPESAKLMASHIVLMANARLPKKVVLETKIKYDKSLLRQFRGSHTKAKQWIDRVIELTRPRMTLHTLKMGVEIKLVGNIEYEDISIKADSPSIQYLGYNKRPKSMESWFAADICQPGQWCTLGIAYLSAACRKDGLAVNINEYYVKRTSELHTARTYAHELGHNIGMKHDFDNAHGGQGGPCNGRGLMSYGDKPDAWSDCSNNDFRDYYRSEGHECMADSGDTTTNPTRRPRTTRSTRRPRTRPPTDDCVDAFNNCAMIAANNWCDTQGYKGKCCKSCKLAIETRDPNCYDKASGCVYYKANMCSNSYHKNTCRKTCGVC